LNKVSLMSRFAPVAAGLAVNAYVPAARLILK